METLVFFMLVGILGLWFNEVHNSRVVLTKVEAPKGLKVGPRKLRRLLK